MEKRMKEMEKREEGNESVTGTLHSHLFHPSHNHRDKDMEEQGVIYTL